MKPRKNERLQEVTELYLAGYKPSEIHRRLTTLRLPAWDISKRTIEKDCQEIRSMISEETNIDLAYELNKELMQIDVVFKECYEQKDFKTCLAALRLRSDLLGLSKHVIEISSDETQNIILGEIPKNVAEKLDYENTDSDNKVFSEN